jgi:hypothetical protein
VTSRSAAEVTDTEQQFTDCLQQIKTLGEEKEQWQKELEDLRGATKNLWTWRIHQKKVKQATGPCWSDFSERRRKSSSSLLKPRSHVSATLSPL